MIVYILGIFTGLLLTGLLIAIDVFIQRKVATGGIQQLLTKATRESGQINIPPSDEILDWEEKLKKNDLLGKDTEFDI